MRDEIFARGYRGERQRVGVDRLAGRRVFAAWVGVLAACIVVLALLVPQLAMASTSGQQSSAVRNYVLGVGDTIRIDVLGEPELSFQVRLTGDGSIQYPFLGRIQAAGKPVGTLRNEITRGLKNGYLVNPQVRVSIVAFRPIYVTGAVNRPGSYPYNIGMTVGNAIAAAGGFNIRASENKIYLLPGGDGNGQKHKVKSGDSISPGDTVIVGEGLF